MKRFRDIIESVDTPENENVLWLDTSNEDAPILKYFRNGKWVQVAGGGGPTPGPTVLSNYFYYGGFDSRATAQTIDISQLNKTKDNPVEDYLGKVYYYIAIAPDQNIDSVITRSEISEDIASDFNSIGQLTIDGMAYTLYEYFLDSYIPFLVRIKISVTEN